MNTKGCPTIPRILFDWITFLSVALPLRSVPTFIELLVGCMITSSGFVCQAWAALPMKRCWPSYYKWLQQGKWSWCELGRRLGWLLRLHFEQPVWHLIIDDTLVFRASRRAPGAGIHHQHGHKANRPDFVLGQCWVSLAAVVERGGRTVAVPLLLKLIDVTGNPGKLVAARRLLRSVRVIFGNARVLLDSWYMRGSLIESLLGLGFEVIGQVRHDSALYALPQRTNRRGRPAIYGEKMTADRVAALPVVRVELEVYGQRQWVQLRSAVVKARFLKGRQVRAVWVSVERDGGNSTGTRLLLATEPALEAESVVTTYAKRWCIEPMFNQLKNGWGIRDAWQQHKLTLLRWVHIRQTAYALMQLLAASRATESAWLASLTPWRSQAPMTAGRLRLGLARIFGQISVRELWDAKSRKFGPKKPGASPPCEDAMRKAL